MPPQCKPVLREKSPIITFVVIWCYINTTDSPWLDMQLILICSCFRTDSYCKSQALPSDGCSEPVLFTLRPPPPPPPPPAPQALLLWRQSCILSASSSCLCYVEGLGMGVAVEGWVSIHILWKAFVFSFCQLDWGQLTGSAHNKHGRTIASNRPRHQRTLISQTGLIFSP